MILFINLKLNVIILLIIKFNSHPNHYLLVSCTHKTNKAKQVLPIAIIIIMMIHYLFLYIFCFLFFFSKAFLPSNAHCLFFVFFLNPDTFFFPATCTQLQCLNTINTSIYITLQNLEIM